MNANCPIMFLHNVMDILHGDRKCSTYIGQPKWADTGCKPFELGTDMIKSPAK